MIKKDPRKLPRAHTLRRWVLDATVSISHPDTAFVNPSSGMQDWNAGPDPYVANHLRISVPTPFAPLSTAHALTDPSETRRVQASALARIWIHSRTFQSRRAWRRAAFVGPWERRAWLRT